MSAEHNFTTNYSSGLNEYKQLAESTGKAHYRDGRTILQHIQALVPNDQKNWAEFGKRFFNRFAYLEPIYKAGVTPAQVASLPNVEGGDKLTFDDLSLTHHNYIADFFKTIKSEEQSDIWDGMVAIPRKILLDQLSTKSFETIYKLAQKNSKETKKDKPTCIVM